MRHKPLLLLTFFLLLTWSFLGYAAEATQSDAEQMQSWWDDLEKPDPEASRALLKMADKPAESVAFLKEHLQPLKIEADEVNKLIKDLESADEEVWKPADEKLRYFDPRLAIELPVLMTDATNPLARSRLTEILADRPIGSFEGKEIKYSTFRDGQNFVIGNGSIWAEKDVAKLCGPWNDKAPWTRAIRAIVLLEHINTPEAVAILKDMSAGHPDAQPTKQANTALENLNVTK
jgi:hypothetical protein